jgi:YD repeat-containing protein
MKIPQFYVLLFALLALFSVACKDDKDTAPTPAGAVCTLTGEATTLSGNEKSWTYEYNDQGQITRINRFNVYGTLNLVGDISGNIVKYASVPLPSTHEVTQVYEYVGGELIDAKPTTASVSMTIDDEVNPDYMTFFFFYDAKGRLELVGEQTDNVNGDLEWDLHIYYNDQDNVTGLYYEIKTSPASAGSTVSVKAYDNKPTPYAGIINWKFLMSNFAWDNYDPEPILTALSKNNPLDYVLNEGNPAQYARTMTYEYNDDGYPTRRTNTNKNALGEYTFMQTFTYDCP